VQKKPDPRPQFGFRILLGWGYCSVGYIILFIGSWAKEILKRLPSPYVSQFYLSLEQPPQVVVSASAAGYYGNRGDEVLVEESSRSSGFLADDGSVVW
jgi:hypothetical protein